MPTPASAHHAHLNRRSFGLWGLAGAAAATGATFAPTASAAATSTFRVGHLNIWYQLTDAAFRDDLNLIAARSDLLGLNEVSGRLDLLRDWADNHGWHIYQPAMEGRDDALLARKSVFERTGEALDRDSIFIGDAGDDVRPAYLNWACWRHIESGRPINHIGTHVYSKIDDNGSPRSSAKLAIAKEHIARIRDLAVRRKEHGQVVVTGDFNIDYVDDKRVRHPDFPYSVLEERQAAGAIPGLRSGFSQHGVTSYPTFEDGRRIDYIYEWVRVPESRVIRMSSHEVVQPTNSDHNGLTAKFTVTH